MAERWVEQLGVSEVRSIRIDGHPRLPDGYLYPKRGAGPRPSAVSITQTYRVLLTRGMLGTFIFSSDDETNTMLNALITQA